MGKCYICGNSTDKVLDLGEIYQSTFLQKDSVATLDKKPLYLCKCFNCGLVQLDKTINLDDTYRQYWYRSGLNKQMVQSLTDVVKSIEERVEFENDDCVIDIGCNDGTLLGLYKNKKLWKIGYDPAQNLKKYAINNCTLFINDYYSRKGFAGKAKVITAIAMFYDLEFPHIFLEDIKFHLDQDGIFVIQMTDLLSMIKSNAFDNICFEHLQVYSLRTLIDLLNYHNLEVFDLEYNNVNGSSLRVYISHMGEKQILPIVTQTLTFEWNFLSQYQGSFIGFEVRIKLYKHAVVSYIKEQIDEGKKVFGMGASTKGNTLLQYFGIDNTIIPYISEVNPEKFGLLTVGSNIEIISQEEAFDKKPDMFLVLPWHFQDELIKQSKDYLKSGGKLLFPLPIPEIVYGEMGRIYGEYLEI